MRLDVSIILNLSLTCSSLSVMLHPPLYYTSTLKLQLTRNYILSVNMNILHWLQSIKAGTCNNNFILCELSRKVIRIALNAVYDFVSVTYIFYYNDYYILYYKTLLSRII